MPYLVFNKVLKYRSKVATKKNSHLATRKAKKESL